MYTYILLIALVIILFFYWKSRNESYVSKREKAEVINSWFEKNKSGGGYSNYKTEVEGSDVLEYSMVKSSPSKSVDTIERLIQ